MSGQEQMTQFTEKLEGKEITVGNQKFTMMQAIIYIASIVNIIACFLPFAVAKIEILGYSDSKSVSWMDGDGVFAIICVIATCVLIFLGKNMFAIIPAAINVIIILVDFISGADVVGETGNEFASASTSFGIGAYLALIAAIVIAVMTVLGLFSEKNKNN